MGWIRRYGWPLARRQLVFTLVIGLVLLLAGQDLSASWPVILLGGAILNVGWCFVA